eukprot:TRINITY_DN3322_c0_g1_i1.p1 TRINITY_DN3322_c0_g1~~TRINITY_DN3322_c0_g1_i1.p1  ORF type:complete len:240 (-),score=-25.26 TRINITY_DN3322_c0_g1_i1:286-1005(-)
MSMYQSCISLLLNHTICIGYLHISKSNKYGIECFFKVHSLSQKNPQQSTPKQKTINSNLHSIIITELVFLRITYKQIAGQKKKVRDLKQFLTKQIYHQPLKCRHFEFQLQGFVYQIMFEIIIIKFFHKTLYLIRQYLLRWLEVKKYICFIQNNIIYSETCFVLLLSIRYNPPELQNMQLLLLLQCCLFNIHKYYVSKLHLKDQTKKYIQEYIYSSRYSSRYKPSNFPHKKINNFRRRKQ